MLTGSLVAIVTPMNTDDSINWDALSSLIDFHLDNNTQAIVAVGTTGESPTLSMSEHKQVIEFVVKKVNGKVPVIAGTGANSTAEAIELSLSAKKAGADFGLSVVPYYNKPNQEGLFQHFKTIAEASGLPTLLYNVPGRTVADLLPETVVRLSKVKNIVGIKEATGDVSRVAQIKNEVGDDFLLYSGDDASARDFILAGGHGVISVTANIVPAQMQAMCEQAILGNSQAAKELDDIISSAHHTLFVDANPIPVKWALTRMGLIPEGIRLPLILLSTEKQAVVEASLKKIGAL